MILQTLKKYWGYEGFRSLQKESVFSILKSVDSLTMLSTGGGKSLCFQLPALLKPGMAVIISPLISLMQDQVINLKRRGISAEYLNSSLTHKEQRTIISNLRGGKIKLLYLSPEKLLAKNTVTLLKKIDISFFIIDEAHCISQWGHEFRPSYRGLGEIRRLFPDKSIHAFTATATKAVESDILSQLKFRHPFNVFCGEVDRPNLIYKIQRRYNIVSQVKEILDKHKGQAGIIYCLSRNDVEYLSPILRRYGWENQCYHAGMYNMARNNVQDKFSAKNINLVIATIAFGMGIDRGDIRFVIHTGMPKSIENYQQETGRAGRDGKQSTCYTLFDDYDCKLWYTFSNQLKTNRIKTDAMYNFCVFNGCKHKALSNYFGKKYIKQNCEACDYCLGKEKKQ